jgi:O-antigen ligase
MLAIFTILVFLRPQEMNEKFYEASWQKFAGIAIIIAVFFRLRSVAWNRLQNSVVKWMAIFIAMTFASVPTSIWPGGSVNFILQVVLREVLIFLFIVLLTTDVVKIRKIGLIMGLCNSVLAALALRSFIRGLMLVGGYRAAVEEGGTFSDPNELALCFVISLPLLYFLGQAWGGKWKVFYGVCVLICAAGTLVTYSRGGAIGLCGVIAAIILLDKQKRRRNLVLALGAGVLVLSTSLGIKERIETVYVHERDPVGSIQARLSILKTGFGIFLEHPLLGTGVGCFAIKEGESHGGLGQWSTAHNSFVQVAAETGFIGLIAFLGCFVSCFRTMRSGLKNKQDDDRAKAAAKALMASMTGFLLCGSFLSVAYSWYFFYLVGLGASLGNLIDRERG